MLTKMIKYCATFYMIILFMVVVTADFRRECRRQSQIDYSTIKNLRNGELNERNSNLKCYLLCVMRKLRFFNKKNEIDINSVMSRLRHLPNSNLQQSVKELMGKCSQFDDSDPCEKAFNIAKCYSEHERKLFQYV